MIEIRK